MYLLDFPDGQAVKNSPYSAGEVGSIPGPRIPHPEGQLSPCTATKTQHSHINKHFKKIYINLNMCPL